ncbi:hypothetical protein GCM10011577_27680 [Pseudarthrobacter polychromogenes]|uniref:Uncharacterized protein n=1 Tax=Pseudarthrobacter polychromogenes TaxID=1676 RepID=A0ABQ1XSW6_9MICC|nr:hypothetical protein GCM10011577_27680 [Pseudarthrobacter polychromogenes]
MAKPVISFVGRRVADRCLAFLAHQRARENFRAVCVKDGPVRWSGLGLADACRNVRYGLGPR